MRATLATLLFLLAGSAALAGPQNGFGLSGGLALHGGQHAIANGDTPSFLSTGASVVSDAQFGVNPDWSLNPFLQLSLERSAGAVSGVISNGAAGIEVRRWWDDLYVAARTGYYVELYSDAGRTSTGYGPGVGIGAGRETPGGLTWSATLEVMSVGYAGVHGGLRLNLGRRWE